MKFSENNAIEIFNAFKEGFLDYVTRSGFTVEYTKGADHLACLVEGFHKLNVDPDTSIEDLLNRSGAKIFGDSFAFEYNKNVINVIPDPSNEDSVDLDGMTVFFYKNQITPEQAEKEGQRLAEAVNYVCGQLDVVASRMRFA